MVESSTTEGGKIVTFHFREKSLREKTWRNKLKRNESCTWRYTAAGREFMSHDSRKWQFYRLSKKKTYARFTCMSYFECFNVTVLAIYCLIRSDKFTFLCLSFRHLVQNKQIVKVLWISTHQTLLRAKNRRFQRFFMVS